MRLLLVLLVAAWCAGTARLWRSAGVGHGVSRAGAACFVLALGALALALLSPIDALAESRFSVHMVQHLLLVAVVPPLFVLGSPVVPLLWSLPRAARRWIAAMGRPLVMLLRAARVAPVIVWSLHTVTVWAWHLPAAYLAAARHPVVHAAEHVSFLLTAMLLWWVVLRPEPGRSPRYATGLVLMLATSVQGAVLGALLFFAPFPWYVEPSPAALTDQQLAGLLMWVPGGMVYLAAAAWFALRWMRGTVASPRPALAAVTAIVVLLCGCRDRPAVAVQGGDAERGREALAGFGCGACHEIHGVVAAHGRVGPPLEHLATRSLIAGELANTADNLVRWIRDPQAIDPGTAMPNLQVSVATARDMAAYLYTLP